MTIQEIKKVKIETERDLLSELRNFEVITGTTVHNIDLRRIHPAGQESEIMNITLDIRID